ncbi:MAG TPA: cobyrinic acid a,c-diamide synthase, partial [Clostridia bacterium]|nr:cobyrinic acid a,c-diamide synthase [Clostridia bacterium]
EHNAVGKALQRIVDRLGAKIAETVDLNALIQLAQTAPPIARPTQAPYPTFQGVSVAVAQDRAFCFAYPDALALLEQMGARLLPFSPLSDKRLPEEAQGLLLPGGYPELYAARLAANVPMRQSLLDALQRGLPCIAECGGFMVLHDTLEDPDGVPHPMVGFLHARAYKTPRLQRFGYVRLTALRDTLLLPKGASIPAHEFHHWDSDQPGDALEARKPLRQTQWRCGICTDTLFAGFPHVHLCANPDSAARFLARCQTFH